jgi:hypothetical protein
MSTKKVRSIVMYFFFEVLFGAVACFRLFLAHKQKKIFHPEEEVGAGTKSHRRTT